jgi:hypothetical protein
MKEKAYKLLMILQGLLWLYMTVQSAVSRTVPYPVIILMLLDGIFFILLAIPDIRKLFFKLVTLAFLGANMILTFTDQLGFMDYLVMGWNLILLLLVFSIILKRKQQ